MNKEIEQLIELKNKIGDERDLCAELYNVWITRLYEVQDDPEKYEMYIGLIGFMEPYGNKLKEDIRVINRRICEIEGVDSIGETSHVRECNNTHGLDMPNAE
jgi:hypothetical protein